MAFITSRKSLNEDLVSLLHDLKIDKLPSINFKKVITRFCEELQLPSILLFSSENCTLLS